MNYLIPLEFHTANKDEPQSLNLVWTEGLVLSLVLKCKLKLGIHFKQLINKEQCFNCLHPYNLTIEFKI